MKIVESRSEAYAQVAQWRQAGASVGLVPTMGALHAGHLALAERSTTECDKSVATIFVNPAQFGPQEDFSRYPRTLDDDLQGLRDNQTDLVFIPQPEELYPAGFSTYVEPPSVALPLEGVFRPTHFRGVTTIVLKLFHILPATVAYFGQKDFQQLTVIRHMVDDLNIPIRVEGCQTVREPDGLALSSRNRYLSLEQRQTAQSLSRALTAVAKQVGEGILAVEPLEQSMHHILREAGIERIDYACIVDRTTLESLPQLDRPAVALIAAHVGDTRLIDNVLL
ncbi:MAG: pantoate--beta-alanine ligase [Planctomycetales bacterium]|nr:pantoate--beta-alanine ligase [Planctomycetales bacterium]